MIFKWETTEDRLNKFLRISPQEKLEWLRQMLEFIEKSSGKKMIELRRKLREK